MDAKLPSGMPEGSWHQAMKTGGMKRIHRGKVRDTFQDGQTTLLVQVATDRISVFDFVLRAEVPQKGATLTALTIHWLKNVRVANSIDNHLVAYGSRISEFLPIGAKGVPELWRRAVVVQKLSMVPIECIVRGYLTGSGLASYQASQQVCGHKLPIGLYDGAKLPKALFTPTTKAEEGHDEHIAASSVDPVIGILSLAIYNAACAYASEREIVIADTKLEFGYKLDTYTLADEVLTPDSSRFWDLKEWLEANKRQASPPSYDKEVVRIWAKKVSTPWGIGIHRLDPKNAEHVQFVQDIEVPSDVLQLAAERYQIIFKRLTGSTLQEFQKQHMHIPD